MFNVLFNILTVIAFLFGGILIAGTCTYTSSGGPYDFDYSFIFSLFGLLIYAMAFIRLRNQMKNYKLLFAILLMLFAIGLFISGQYVISSTYINPEETMADIFPPKPFNIATYLITSIFTFMYGIYLLFDKYDKLKQKSKYYSD